MVGMFLSSTNLSLTTIIKLCQYILTKISVRLWILCKFNLYLWKLRLSEETPPHSSNNNSEKLPKKILMESPNFGRHSQQEGEKKKKRINKTIMSN